MYDKTATFKDHLANRISLLVYQQRISNFVSNNNKKAATDYLYNVTDAFKLNHQYEHMFFLEMFYLKQLAKSDPIEIADFFSEFLDTAFFLLQTRMTDANYIQDFSVYLLQEVLELGDLIKQDNTRTIQLFECAINFFLNNGSNFANLLVLKIGDILREKTESLEIAIDYYKKVFTNLLSLASRDTYVPSHVDLRQLKDALEKICSATPQSNPTYHILKRLIETYDPKLFRELISTTIKRRAADETPNKKLEPGHDYNLYMNVNYIFTLLVYIQKKSPTLLSPDFTNALNQKDFIEFIKTLRKLTSIFDAIDSGNDETVKDLIDAKLALNVIGPEGATPLQHALRKKSKGSIQHLVLSQKVDLEETDTEKGLLPPPLYLAIDYNLDTVCLLLKNGVKVAAPAGSNLPSPLFYAIMSGKKDIARLLLEHWAKLTPNELNTLNNSTHPKHQLFKDLCLQDQASRLNFLNEKEPHNNLLCPLNVHDIKSSTKTAIFCPFAVDGFVESYRTFARAFNALEPDRPIFGIISPSISKQGGVLPPTLEQKAALVIETIKSMQPLPPYIFFGQSFGGLMVYEIARQLMAKGEEVIIVGIFDTLAPIAMQQMTNEQYAEHLSRVVSNLSPYFGATTHTPPTKNELMKLSKEDQIKAAIPSNDQIEKGSRQAIVNTIRSNLIAALHYDPPITKADDPSSPFVTCFNAEETCNQYGKEHLGWQEQTSDYFAQKILPQANHFSIINDPEVAREIAEFISGHRLVQIADTKKAYWIMLNVVLSNVQLVGALERNRKLLARLYGGEYDRVIFGTKGPTFFERRLSTDNTLTATVGEERGVGVNLPSSPAEIENVKNSPGSSH